VRAVADAEAADAEAADAEAADAEAADRGGEVLRRGRVNANGDAGSDSAPGISANPAPGIWARA